MAQLSLFGDASKPPKPRKPHPLAPWYDAVAAVIGPVAAKASAGRVLRVAKLMQLAGLAPESVALVPGVVRRYAPWRKVIDLSAVQACWPWVLEPPQTVEQQAPGSLDLLAGVMARNGGRMLK